MRETKKRAGQWWLKYMGIKEGSNQPRGVYYSRIYKESDEYFRKIIKIFEEVCIKEKVYKKIKVKKELKSVITIKKEKITEVLKNKLWNKTLERMNKELIPDDKLTPAFDVTIKNGQVKFENRSDGYTEIEWDFGNGVVSREVNPTVRLPKGKYTVKLTVKNNCKSRVVVRNIIID
jgi:hypothetical protein